MPISISSRQLIPSKTKHESTRQQKDARRDAIKKIASPTEPKKKKKNLSFVRKEASAQPM